MLIRYQLIVRYFKTRSNLACLCWYACQISLSLVKAFVVVRSAISYNTSRTSRTHTFKRSLCFLFLKSRLLKSLMSTFCYNQHWFCFLKGGGGGVNHFPLFYFTNLALFPYTSRRSYCFIVLFVRLLELFALIY